MNEKLMMLSATAAVVAVGWAGFQAGVGVSADDVSRNLNVAIEILEKETSELPNEKQQELRELFGEFISYMKRTGVRSELEPAAVEREASKLVTAAAEVSLAAYRAKESPYAIEESVVNLFCDDKISVAYLGEHRSYGSALKVHGKTTYMKVGDHAEHSIDGKTLHLLVLEYSQQESSPVLKYECSS